MGLVVPFAKEITANRVSKLEADIKEIDTPSGRGKDNISKEIKDRLVREKHFWIENFHCTYQHEQEKNERLYVLQWTTKELVSGKVWIGRLKEDSRFASEIWKGVAFLLGSPL